MAARSLIVALLLLPALAACQGEPTTHPLEPSGPTASGMAAAEGSVGDRDPGVEITLTDPRLNESSGLALSHRFPGVLYSHNDRGRAPELFAVDASGTRAVLRVDAPALDWEDVATTPDGRIWIGDIGDNDRIRTSVSVVVVSEPDVLVSATLPSTSYDFRYPDGPHDAEALLVHPVTGRLYIVTKDPDGGTVYAAPRRLSADRVNRLTPVAEAPPNVTSGAFDADGSLLVLRNQGRAYFGHDFGDAPTVVPLPKQEQGEAIEFAEDGHHVLIGTEGEHSVVLRVRVPTDVEGSSS